MYPIDKINCHSDDSNVGSEIITSKLKCRCFEKIYIYLIVKSIK